jgi:competence protein ComFC
MNSFVRMRCLICHEMIQPKIGWRAIFSEEEEQLLCTVCEGKLEKIEGERCRICSRSFQQLDEQFRHHDLCHDCVRWEEDEEWRGYLDSNHSIYHYHDFFKEVMARYKFRGDYVLSKIFTVCIQEHINNVNPDIIVPIPLSEERLYERGFNQSEALIIGAGYTAAKLLMRTHSEKQSKKSRSQRIDIPQVFQIEPSCELTGKTIVIIDDIYTTGSTLRHAAKLLKIAGAIRIQSLTIAR